MDDLIKAAMPALLNHPEAREKVLAYLQALVDEKRPEKEWRQVWWQLSDDVRRHKETDIHTGVKHPKVRLFMQAFYNQWGAGLIVGDIVHGGFDPRANNRWGSQYFDHQFHKGTCDASDYVDVIITAQQVWSHIHAKWVSETLPLGDDDTR